MLNKQKILDKAEIIILCLRPQARPRQDDVLKRKWVRFIGVRHIIHIYRWLIGIYFCSYFHIGYEIGRILNIETIFAERINGIFSLRRGFEIKKGQKTLIVEDVITTGKSSLECSDLAKKMGAEILGYGCIIDRSNGKSNINKEIVSQVEIEIPTYTKENLPKHLEKIKPIKPGSRNL